ncbi:MAG: hypothetical protein ACRCTY_00365, partial [Candidatus Adiutrix sp.]
IVNSVKNGLILLSAALKNSTLYPPGNKIRQSSLMVAKQWFDGFLNQWERLPLTVHKDRLTYQDEIVFQDKAEEQSIIFPLYRDGVQWLEFSRGITIDELEALINLINRFRVLRDEAEDDLVTAMWEIDFVHLKYQTADFFADVDLNQDNATDMSLITIPDSPNPISPLGTVSPHTKSIDNLFLYLDSRDGPFTGEVGAEGSNRPQSELVSPPQAESGAPSGIVVSTPTDEQKNIWELTPKEERQLKSLIASEAHRQSAADNLEIMMILVGQLTDSQDNRAIGNFMAETVKEALQVGDMACVSKYTHQLKNINLKTHPALDGLPQVFFKEILSANTIERIIEFCRTKENLPEDYFKGVHFFLLALPPDLVYRLIPAVARAGHRQLGRIFLGVIAIQLPKVEVRQVLDLIKEMSSDLIVELISLVKAYHPICPFGFFEPLLRHQVLPVREAAVKTFLAYDPENIKKMLYLLAEPTLSLNALICTALAKMGPNAFAENALMDYIGGVYRGLETQEPQALLNCYMALGRCGTEGAISFLEAILFKKAWKSIFSKKGKIHRQGAAVALSLMPSYGRAATLLQKAANSRFSAIRQAFYEAQEYLKVNTHGQ